MRTALVTYAYADAALRARHREDHLTRLRELVERGVVLLAGPDVEARGAVLVMVVANEPAAREVMDADVYVRTGAVVDYEVTMFDPVVGSALPPAP